MKETINFDNIYQFIMSRNFENFVALLKQNTPEYILQLKIDLANKYKNEMKIKGEY